MTIEQNIQDDRDENPDMAGLTEGEPENPTKKERLIQSDFVFWGLWLIGAVVVAYTFFNIGFDRWEREQPIYPPMTDNPLEDDGMYLLIAHASW